MRLGFCKNKDTDRRELVLRPGTRELVSASRLLWLKANDCDVLLPCSSKSGRNPKRIRLHYDVDGLVSFKRYVRKRPLSAMALSAMLMSTLQAVAWCVQKGVGYAALLFDERYVFVDGRAGLHFLFVPLDAMDHKANNTPLTLLGALGNAKRMRPESPDALALCERLGDFLLEEDGIFSFNRFRDFVRTQTGAAIPWHEAHAGTSGQGNARESQGRSEGDDGPSRSVNTRNASNGLSQPTPSYVLHDKIAGVDYALAGDAMILGRGSDCDVRLCDRPNLSRMHALMRLDDEGVILRDLNSSNGIHVDGKRLKLGEEVRVSYGTSFFLAGDEFSVKKREGK